MTTIAVLTTPAPSTPLNLRLGPIYAPRRDDVQFAGFRATEPTPDVGAIEGYGHNGEVVEVFRGSMIETWIRLSRYLGMVDQGTP